MSSHFTVVSYNVCGVNNIIRRTELQQFVSTSRPSVLILQEPKIDHRLIGDNGKVRTPTLPPRLKDYIVCSFNHAVEPTGVLFYIHKSCTFMPLTHLPHCTPYRSHVDGTRTVAGFVWVSSPLLSCPIVLGGVYMHNTSNKADFKALTRSVSLASHPLPSSPPSYPPLPVCLVGDFNARHRSWDSQCQDSGYTSQQGKWLHAQLTSPTAQPRLTLLNTHFPSSCMIPTHTDRRTDSVIDLALTTHAHMVSRMDVLTHEVIGSDHFPIMLTFCAPPSSFTSSPVDVDIECKYDSAPTPDAPMNERVRWRTDCDWSLYARHVAESLPDWFDQYSKWAGKDMPADLTQAHIDTCWQKLLDVMIDSARACVGTVHVDPRCQEWWSPHLTSLHNTYRRCRRRLRRLRKCRATPVHVLFAAQTSYKKARTAFKSAVGKARTASWDALAAACDNVTERRRHKLLWHKYKRTVPSSRVPFAPFADVNGAPPTSTQHKLDNMAAHLARISSLAPDPAHDQHWEQHVRMSMSDVPSRPRGDERAPFSLEDVVSVCSKFRLNTAFGSDNVSPFFLRYGGDDLHRALFLLFSICSRSGLMPASFRHGHVMVLYKGDGDVSDPNNYRPICITSVVARVYERIHVNALVAAMTNASMPSREQFGFTRKRSTHDAVFRFLSHLVDSIDKGEEDDRFSAGVFVDISKAYDKVWIEGLLYKIRKMGITGNLYYMLKSLLTDRTIQVVGMGKVSALYALLAGVPQGSILAPFLFIIYIHDIICTNSVPDAVMSLFADDIALLSKIPGLPGLVPMQHALDHMSRFAAKWKITFSAKKTNVVFFRFSQLKHQQPKHTLTLTGFRIASASQYAYLGVTLDDRLTFIPHLHALTSRTAQTSYMISRLIKRGRLPSFPVIRSLVACLLIPQMVYAFPFTMIDNKSSSLFRITGKAGSKNIYRALKNNIIRPLCFSLGLPRGSHHASVFIESRLLDIDHLQSLATARLVHRWLSMPSDATNEAARMFRSYLASPPRSPLHPFTRMVVAISRISNFHFSVADVTPFVALKSKELQAQAWNHQYSLFRTDLDRSLPQMYTADVPNKDVPLYTHIDSPYTAAHRARLRFRRARLRFNMHRLNFPDAANPKCTKCNMDEDETTFHVLLECSAYAKPRKACVRALRALAPFLSLIQISVRTILSPELVCTRISRRHFLPEMITITGRFIDAVYSIRQF